MTALVVRFPVDDAVVSGLHARAFATGDREVRPWAARLERHALTWVGAFDQERLVGFVQVAWDGGEHAFVLDTMVDPAAQRNGIGSELVAAATRSGLMDHMPVLSSDTSTTAPWPVRSRRYNAIATAPAIALEPCRS